MFFNTFRYLESEVKHGIPNNKSQETVGET